MSRILPPVDDDVFEALQRLAEPLVDDINSVLRRLLNLDSPSPTVATERIEAPGLTGSSSDSPPVAAPGRKIRRATKKRAVKPKKSRAARGSLLPESEYELPMLEFLVEAGGRAPASEVVEAIGARLKDRFTPTDLEALDSGDIRWKSRTQFVRLKLIKQGAMVKDAPRGIWEISDLGRELVDGRSQ